MKKFIFLILISVPFWISAQDGKLISSKKIVFPDSILQRLNSNPAFSNIQSTTEVFAITYLSDSLKINGFLARPKTEGVYPVIIFNRGGNRDFGALNEPRATFILGTMASWGYVVVASNYRGGGGSEGMEEFGGRDLNDISNLIPMLSYEKMADTSRIGVYGFSRGAMMTYMLLRNNCTFKAAIIGAGDTNLKEGIAERPEMEQFVYKELIPDYENNKDVELEKRSAIFWTDELCKTTPLMLMHGSADWRVSPGNSLNILSKLYQNKHPVRFHFFEGAQHGLSEFQDLVWSNIRSFFDHYVKNENPLPDMEPHGR